MGVTGGRRLGVAVWLGSQRFPLIVFFNLILEIHMAKYATFEGTLRIRSHAEKGVMLDKGVETSTLTAADAVTVLSKAVAYADANKMGLDRWSFYIPEVSQKLAKDAKHVTVAQVKAALKAGNVPTIRTGNWGKPVMTIAHPVKQTSTKASKFGDDIA